MHNEETFHNQLTRIRRDMDAVRSTLADMDEALDRLTQELGHLPLDPDPSKPQQKERE